MLRLLMIIQNTQVWTDMKQEKQLLKIWIKKDILLRSKIMTHNVGTCYRCHTTIEPRVSKQWFVKMEEIAKPAIEAVKNGDTKFVPPSF